MIVDDNIRRRRGFKAGKRDDSLLNLVIVPHQTYLQLLLEGIYCRYPVMQVSRIIITSDKRAGTCFCPCLSVCLSVSKIRPTQKRVHGFG